MNTRMQVNGLYAELNMPAALTGDRVHSLPPHNRMVAHLVDEYPGCPNNWMHGSSKASSYFVGVEAGRGLWFDFTMNAGHAHDIAVVISVQGINPITGLPDKKLNLLQIKNKCPKHDVELAQGFCRECGYKLPAQNYISTTTGQVLWLDGFRNSEGKVRQYILTEEELRGIATQVIGDERVWAIGFAFYLSKQQRPAPSLLGIGGYDQNQQPVYHKYYTDEPYAGQQLHKQWQNVNWLGSKCSCEVNMTNQPLMSTTQPPPLYTTTQPPASYNDASPRGFNMPASHRPKRMIRSCSAAPKKQITAKKLEIGAGAQIAQDVGVDPNPIDFWQPEPAGLIYVNYVPKEQCQAILAQGKRTEMAEGPLTGLRVGN